MKTKIFSLKTVGVAALVPPTVRLLPEATIQNPVEIVDKSGKPLP